ANTGSSAPARSVQTDTDDAGFERLTHPSRILFPDGGITKLDLARYYRDIAPWILPHLAGRPLTLVRCPQGQGRQCFFQRHAGATTAGIDTVAIPGSDGEAPYMVANSEAALIALVQLGVLELHTWGAREGRLDKPDRIIFDLDPAPGLEWMRVIEAAQLLRALLEELGLVSFVKTTGGKGLHVVIPLQPKKPWAEIKDFSRAVAEHLAATFPDRFTASMAKSARGGRIFIDYLRNAAEATAVAAYSTRARPGAPVSTPIGWDELGPELHSDTFNLHNIRARLQGLKEDPWAAYFTVRQSLSVKIQRALERR
ncbi:MAG: non-homologous end-joining DNA ligase, partial [Burkholderiaceae bacterium]